jgi:hypothetical protein
MLRCQETSFRRNSLLSLPPLATFCSLPHPLVFAELPAAPFFCFGASFAKFSADPTVTGLFFSLN